MSYRTLTNSAPPATPAGGKTTDFVDTTGRPSALNSTGVLNVLSARALPNLIRNSGWWFAQRQAPGTPTTYSSTTNRVITADGWGIVNENTSTVFSRTDTQAAPETGLQSRFYGQYSKVTTTGKIVVSQVIEGTESSDMRGRSVRFQVWLKGIVVASQIVKIAVVQLTSAGTIDTMPATFITAFGAATVDPTLGTNLAFLPPRAGVSGDNCTAGTNAFSCTVTNAWQRYGGVVDVPTTAKNLVVMIWSDTGLVATNGFAIAQASLTSGFEIQDWSPASLPDELQRVQRFYAKTFAIDTAPTQNLGVNSGELKWVKVAAAATLSRSPQWFFPFRMRATPTTVTLFSPGSATAQVRDETGNLDCSATAAILGGDAALSIVTTGNAATAAENLLGIHITADAEII